MVGCSESEMCVVMLGSWGLDGIDWGRSRESYGG